MTRTGRCICGLRVSLHFTPTNRKLSCEETANEHPYALRVVDVLASRFREIIRQEKGK